jgi:hypothetical protein
MMLLRCHSQPGFRAEKDSDLNQMFSKTTGGMKQQVRIYCKEMLLGCCHVSRTGGLDSAGEGSVSVAQIAMYCSSLRFIKLN